MENIENSISWNANFRAFQRKHFQISSEYFQINALKSQASESITHLIFIQHFCMKKKNVANLRAYEFIECDSAKTL